MKKDELRLKTLVAMKKIMTGMKELNELWLEEEKLNFLDNSYPFDVVHDDFSTLSSEVAYWYDYHYEYLLK